ncbi:MAG: alkaline phosphatase D family protein, partial [Aquificaceae bacterium]|nr:alkaline phosphatase D family protein [Aquificaceae bacterium]MDW8237395.1 alkaline phosphatase D family protein [Aquificaceae bacterium]
LKLYLLERGSTKLREFSIPASSITPLNDYCVKFQVGNLKPDTQYVYIFEYDSYKKVGKFKTLPQNPHSMKIAFVSCQNFEDGYYPAYYHIAMEDLNFVLHLGDVIYEAMYSPKIPQRAITLPSGAKSAMSLEDYRYLYLTYLSDPNFQLARASHAFIHTIDDHEFYNDYYFDYSKGFWISPNFPPEVSSNKELALTLWQYAFKCFKDYIPSRIKLNLSSSNPLDWLLLYRDFKAGSFMHLIVTDNRTYRQSQCPVRFQSPGCESQQYHTLLGQRQKEWFLNKLTKKDARWKIWANSVQFSESILDGLYASTDAWSGYLKERNEILDVISSHTDSNLIILTGDRHAFVASEVQRKFGKDERPIGAEFVTGAISSINASEGLWFKRSFPNLKNALEYERFELSSNPWYRYVNHTGWGYGLLSLSKSFANVQFYLVNKYYAHSERLLAGSFLYEPNNGIK